LFAENKKNGVGKIIIGTSEKHSFCHPREYGDPVFKAINRL